MAIEEALDAGLAAVRKKQASTIYFVVTKMFVYICLLIRSDPDIYISIERINLSALLFF